MSRYNKKRNTPFRLMPEMIFFGALSLGATFPLWIEPASRLESLGDPLLNSFILSWAHYALFNQIGDFFQANFFWPHANALAFGEHLLAPAILALPIRLFTGSPAAIHLASLLEAYLLSALAAYALAYHYFGSRPAATLAGLAYGFAGYRIAQSTHIQLIHGEFLPIMVLAFERALGSNRRGWLFLLGLSSLGQWLTSWYWTVFSLGTLGPYFIVRLWHRRREISRRRVMAVVITLVLAALAVLPIARPYLVLRAKGAYVRPRLSSEGLSARTADFLRPSKRNFLHGSPRVPAKIDNIEMDLFPGWAPILALGIALGAAVRRGRQSSPRPAQNSPSAALADFPLRLWLGITFLLLLFCCGPSLEFTPEGSAAISIPLPLGLIERLVPVAGVMRVPARWMMPALLGISMLMAYVVQGLIVRWGGRGRMLAIALGLLTLAESLARPMPYVRVDSRPAAVDQWLARQPFPSPILNLPMRPLDDNRDMLDASWHHQPIVTGSNGFLPYYYRRRLRDLERFPAPEALALLKKDRVRYVIIDSERMWGENAREAEKEKLIRRFGGPERTLVFGEQIVIDLSPGSTAP